MHDTKMMQKRIGQQEYKQTEIGRIPKEWEVRAIGEITKTSSGGTPSRNKKDYFNGDIPWVKSGELKDNVIDDTEEKITIKGLHDSSAKLFTEGTLLIALYGATVGKTGILGIKATTNQAVCAIMSRPELINSKFLQNYLILKRKQLISASSGGAQPNISQEIIRAFKIPLPPLPEQKKIAEVLSTVDKAIEKVGEALEKTERLKKGLMQKLLTRGIGHKELKETEIGRIPKEWEVVGLGNSAEVIMGQSPSGDTYNEKMEGLPLINGPSEFGKRYPIPFKWTTEPTKTSRKGDILICVRGHTTGRLNISNGIYCAGRGIAIIRSKEISQNLFIYYILESNREKIYGMSYAAGSTFPNITNGQLNKFSILLPPLAEQKKIAEILSTVDKRLELLRKKEEKLERVKKGLMDDLLSGRKRVKVL